MRTNYVPKDVSERDSALSWFESLILALVNAKLFQIRPLKREKKEGILDRDSRRKPDSRTCERKALSERDLCVCILEMRAEAMHGSISADCAVGTKYYLAMRRSWSWLGRRLHVNAHSSNHDPNHVLDRDLKRLSERDSFSCEHRAYQSKEIFSVPKDNLAERICIKILIKMKVQILHCFNQYLWFQYHVFVSTVLSDLRFRLGLSLFFD